MTINKYIAALILTFGLTAPALAECPEGTLSVDAFIAKVQKNKATNSILPDSLIKALEAKAGKPPHANDGPYSVIRVDANGFSALQVIVDGCTTEDHIGPMPSEKIDQALGVVNG